MTARDGQTNGRQDQQEGHNQHQANTPGQGHQPPQQQRGNQNRRPETTPERNQGQQSTRSDGLTVLAVLFGVSGVSAVFFGLMLVQVNLAAIGLGSMAIGVGYFYAAHGIWNLQPSGWTAGMVVLGAGTLMGLYVLVKGTGSVGLFSTALSGGMLWYLHSHKEFFTDRRPSQHPTQQSGRQPGNQPPNQ